MTEVKIHYLYMSSESYANEYNIFYDLRCVECKTRYGLNIDTTMHIGNAF